MIIDDDILKLLAKIKNDEQAINFFNQVFDLSPVKIFFGVYRSFIYKGFWTPYNLVILD